MIIQGRKYLRAIGIKLKTVRTHLICLFTLLLALVILLNTPSFAKNKKSTHMETLVLSRAQSSYSVGPFLELLEDPTGLLTLSDINHVGFDKKFFKNQEEVPNFGYTDSVFWVRFKIKNQSPPDIHWVLEMGFSNLHHITLFKPVLSQSKDAYEVIKTGSLTPFKTRQIAYPTFVFNLKPLPSNEKYYYLKFQSQASMTLPLTIWEKTAFEKMAREALFQYGILYGVFLIMMAYNTFLYISLREPYYLYYVFSMFSLISFLAVYSGYASQFFWPNSLWQPALIIPGILTFSAISTNRFTCLFLDIRNKTPKMLKSLRIIEFISWIALLLTPFVEYQYIIKPVLLIVVIDYLLIYMTSILMIRYGNRSFYFFLFALSIFLFTTITLIATRVGILPSTYFTEHYFKGGGMLLVLFLSLALADRINEIKKEKEIANIKLESEIAQRIKVEKNLVKARYQAEKANQIKTDFLANMSHELRTPMHHILSFSRFGIDKIGKAPNDKIEHYFEMIKKSGIRLMNLLNNLLDLSKLEAGKMRFLMDKHNLVNIIEKTVAEFGSTLQESGVTLNIIEPDFSTDIICDVEKITQVTQNLLINAIKFTSSGKVINIRFEQYKVFNSPSKNNSAILVTIQDEGIGIPKEEMKTIFDKFIQSSKTKSNAEGTGLGLAICHEIITAHHGKIWAENNPNGGSIFHFTLPYEQHYA
jgi:two-component system, sensor histidine kinase LadS